MKKISYLAAIAVILALFVLGCSQGATTSSSQNEIVPQLSSGLTGNPIGNCCPEGFVFESGIGDPKDRNGDGAVCRRVTNGNTITFDNNAAGDCCSPYVPPGCI